MSRDGKGHQVKLKLAIRLYLENLSSHGRTKIKTLFKLWLDYNREKNWYVLLAGHFRHAINYIWLESGVLLWGLIPEKKSDFWSADSKFTFVYRKIALFGTKVGWTKFNKKILKKSVK